MSPEALGGILFLSENPTSNQERMAEQILVDAGSRIRYLAEPLMDMLRVSFPMIEVDVGGFLESSKVQCIPAIPIVAGLKHGDEAIFLCPDGLHKAIHFAKPQKLRPEELPRSYPLLTTCRRLGETAWCQYGIEVLRQLNVLKSKLETERIKSGNRG